VELIDALRLKPPCIVAFAGAGGKTTAMMRTARELTERYGRLAIVTTTTHLGSDQVGLGNRHVVVDSPLAVEKFVKQDMTGVTVITGAEAGEGRLGGLGGETLLRLKELAGQSELALLIEADGSRLRPLKAPAEHEPAIPDFADTVVVVCGLKALGKPLTAEWVHRPELFAKLCGLQLGEIVIPEAIAQVLVHRGVGKRPASSRRSCC
jgi:probable selenium-dependent hydroxylase accessory protein YqeC